MRMRIHFLVGSRRAVSRGVKEAAGVNVIVTIAKCVPLAMFVLSIILLGKFDPAILHGLFLGRARRP